MIHLKSSRLEVEIGEPGVFPNTTIRFDRSAFITKVILDGKHSFCTVEPDKPELPRTGGRGICSEIKADTDMDSCAGGQFHKFGVGLLTKPDDEAYSFRRIYECEPYNVAVSSSVNCAEFGIDTPECCGFALREEKRVSVSENELLIEYFFRNTGKKDLTLGEYCHNFITIDDLPIGPDYYLSMPVTDQKDKKVSRGTGSLHGCGSGFTFDDYFEDGTSLFLYPDEITDKDNFSWTLTHRSVGARITEKDSFTPGRILIWTIGCNISPEIYNIFTLTPGGEIRYFRKYVFED